jgi:hypothetical protein
VPQIVMSIQESGNRLDGSVRRAAYAFLEKLSENDALPGLHVEPIHNSADGRVRTGRVDQFWRAVMFKVGKGVETVYVYLGVWPHDDAIKLAQRAILKQNPVNGIAELILAEPQPDMAVAATSKAATGQDVAGEVKAAPPLLPTAGITKSALVEDLGLDPDLCDRALTATSDDELLTIAASAITWQGEALVELAAGGSIASVREALQLETVHRDPDPDDEDTSLIAALKHPAARMQFAFVEDDEDLRRAIEDEDFAAWRVFLHPEQQKYVSTRFSGSFRLSGGAGTGKTVVLLHRARMLHHADPSRRIVLTTFTKNLAEQMRRDLLALDPSIMVAAKLGERGVFVTGVDAAVSAALRSVDQGALGGVVERVLGPRSGRIQGRNTQATEQWREAIDTVSDGLLAGPAHPSFFEAEYAMVVLPQLIVDRAAYFKARRPGRGVSLDRVKRNAVWSVIEAYRASSSVSGHLDFGEAAAVAASMLSTRTAKPADHVLVDEGQDLSPTHWQFLRSLVSEGPDDLFIAEDSHQRIYGQRVVLGRFGIRIVGRSRRLALNYRTTAQNLKFAVGVLEGGEFVDMEEASTDVAGYRSARTGPAPRLVTATTVTEELGRAAEVVGAWLEDDTIVPETIGILVRDMNQASHVARGLEERDVRVRVITNQARISRIPQVMTMHRAKGMEFSRVLIYGASDDSVPAAYVLANASDAERADTLLRERSLFYVAATRARDELVILWSGEPSPFLSDPPG